MAEQHSVLPGIAFSRKRASVLIHLSTIRALGYPRYVRILCNEKRKRLAVQVCAEKESGAIRVAKGRVKEQPLLLSSLIVQGRIWNLCGWDTNKNYLVYGIFRSQQELVEFNLLNAEAITDDMFIDPEFQAK